MSRLSTWTLHSVQLICLCTVALVSFLPATAEFFPDKGVTVSHWKVPEYGFESGEYYWLNQHQLVYPVQNSSGQAQYIKLDLATGTDQNLERFTKLVRGTVKSSFWLPFGIVPSPDGKYLAWITRSTYNGDVLFIASKGGSIVSRQPAKSEIYYPAWSSDSRWCFWFLEGRVRDADERESFVFTAISAINIKTPSQVRTFPISLSPQGERTSLAGSYGRALPYGGPVIGEGPGDPGLSDFHFGTDSDITLISPKEDIKSDTVIFEKFNFASPSYSVTTHSMLLPDDRVFDFAVFSPKGDAIAWKLQRENYVDIWISDGNGKNLKRIGKFYPGQAGKRTSVIHNDVEPHALKWLPNGKAISFREAGELYVVTIRATI